MAEQPIVPTIGRIVWFHSKHLTGGRTIPAIVSEVHSDTSISATTFPVGSAPQPFQSIPYDPDQEMSWGWRWMDYQLSQAAPPAETSDKDAPK